MEENPLPFYGQIMLFGGNFAPKNWMFCDGKILSIQQNPPLFSIIGTMYGGNGTVNFALPDLRDREPKLKEDNIGLRHIICVKGNFPHRSNYNF